MSSPIPFPSTRARRRPIQGAEDNLADISQPAALEGNIISTLAGVMAASLSTFGTEKTLDLITEAIKAARRHSHE